MSTFCKENHGDGTSVREAPAASLELAGDSKERKEGEAGSFVQIQTFPRAVAHFKVCSLYHRMRTLTN